jgi:Mrp family chromosome partitioning ATPase
MRDHMTRWREEFDHIIIDTPPCLSVTDAVVLSPAADRIILVARAGKTSKPALRRACELLLHVNGRVMGIVLNALDLRSSDDHYYAYGGPDAHHYYDEASRQDETATASKVS